MNSTSALHRDETTRPACKQRPRGTMGTELLETCPIPASSTGCDRSVLFENQVSNWKDTELLGRDSASRTSVISMEYLTLIPEGDDELMLARLEESFVVLSDGLEENWG